MITQQCGTNFEVIMAYLRSRFLRPGSHDEVNTGHWQAIKGTPHSQTRELRHVTLEVPIQPTRGSWAANIKPNLPWADDHFAERVSGQPLNPGKEYKNWPWYRGGVEDHKLKGKFSHSYMERFWPKKANFMSCTTDGRMGVRYRYGDLNDLLDLLAREPHTRQAYLPIWFPEDLHAAAVEQERVPCTLGYHLMLRDDKLHCFYPMRSVDYVRYLRDDVYMAGLLVQWVLERLKDREEETNAPAVEQGMGKWQYVEPGTLSLFASSLHIFEGDVPKLQREAGAEGSV